MSDKTKKIIILIVTLLFSSAIIYFAYRYPLPVNISHSSPEMEIPVEKLGKFLSSYSKEKISSLKQDLSIKNIRDKALSPQEVFGHDNKQITILFLGLDYNWIPLRKSKKKDTNSSRSDCMILLRVDFQNNKVKALSIPRDLRVIVPKHGYQKINTAYALGKSELAVKTVVEFLEVPVNYHLVLDIDQAKKLVDLLGDVEIDVEKDMDYDDSWGNLHIHLKKGKQKLSGEQAIGYIRFRNDHEADIGRLRRQQQFLKALLKKFNEPAALLKADKIIKIASEGTETNLKFTQMLALANFFSGVSKTEDSFESATLKGKPVMLEGVSYLICEEEDKKEVIKKFFTPENKDEVVAPKSLNSKKD